MKCVNCGAAIPEDKLYCEFCGREVQIVPDYNPLDEVLAAQVKGAISQTGTVEVDDPEYEKSRKNMTRAHRETEQERQHREREQRRRQMQKKKQRARKKRRRVLIFMSLFLIAVIILGVVLYQNSYTGQVNKGNKALQKSEYEAAEKHFSKAKAKRAEKVEAYIGLSKVYMAQKDLDRAETVFLDAIVKQKDNIIIYKALIQFYMDTDQKMKITELLHNDVGDNVRNELSEYVSKEPEFSLPDDQNYEEVQELSIQGGGAIYYTLDDTQPSPSSIRYDEPIQIAEGTTIVRAINVNGKGIPSFEVKKSYTVELPIEDAPAVTPSTGQYDQDEMIVIKVPEGYTAYYTLNGSTPTKDSKKYTEPIPMPEGNTFFSAVLIDSKGRSSDVTKRNYELIYE